ncbi:MAG: hypothetical protein ACOX1S_12465 [Anaerostipes sp.]|jgi:hypothetical protein
MHIIFIITAYKEKMDNIFRIYKEGEYANQRRISYFGWEGKGIHGFYNYIIGYRKASEVIYEAFISAGEEDRIDIQDTIGFPLCFNYRQCIELYLKYFFVKYGVKEEIEFERFLGKVGHSLIKAWKKVKPILYHMLQYQNISDGNLCIIDKYIEEWHNFDVTSMRMRYPITKFGDAMNSNSVRLDIVNLKEKIGAVKKLP